MIKKQKQTTKVLGLILFLSLAAVLFSHFFTKALVGTTITSIDGQAPDLNGNILTSTTTPAFSGTAEAGSLVSVYDQVSGTAPQISVATGESALNTAYVPADPGQSLIFSDDFSANTIGQKWVTSDATISGGILHMMSPNSNISSNNFDSNNLNYFSPFTESSFTAEADFSIPTDPSSQWLISLDVADPTNPQQQGLGFLWANGAPGQTVLQISQNNSPTDAFNSNYTPLNFGQSYHLKLSYDSTANRADAYIDGNLVLSTANLVPIGYSKQFGMHANNTSLDIDNVVTNFHYTTGAHPDGFQLSKTGMQLNSVNYTDPFIFDPGNPPGVLWLSANGGQGYPLPSFISSTDINNEDIYVYLLNLFIPAGAVGNPTDITLKWTFFSNPPAEFIPFIVAVNSGGLPPGASVTVDAYAKAYSFSTNLLTPVISLDNLGSITANGTIVPPDGGNANTLVAAAIVNPNNTWTAYFGKDENGISIPSLIGKTLIDLHTTPFNFIAENTSMTSGVIQVSSVVPNQPPSDVSDLIAIPTSNQGAALTWSNTTDPDGNLSGYEVYNVNPVLEASDYFNNLSNWQEAKASPATLSATVRSDGHILFNGNASSPNDFNYLISSSALVDFKEAKKIGVKLSIGDSGDGAAQVFGVINPANPSQHILARFFRDSVGAPYLSTSVDGVESERESIEALNSLAISAQLFIDSSGQIKVLAGNINGGNVALIAKRSVDTDTIRRLGYRYMIGYEAVDSGTKVDMALSDFEVYRQDLSLIDNALVSSDCPAGICSRNIGNVAAGGIQASFAVKSVDTFAAKSHLSNIPEITTTLTAPVTNHAPNLVTGLSASAEYWPSNSIKLNWDAASDSDAPNDKVVSYKLYLGAGAGKKAIALVDASKYCSLTDCLNYMDMGGLPNETRIYSISALDSYGSEGQISGEISVTKLPNNQPPYYISDLAGTAINFSTVNLTWSATHDPEDSASANPWPTRDEVELYRTFYRNQDLSWKDSFNSGSINDGWSLIGSGATEPNSQTVGAVTTTGSISSALIPVGLKSIRAVDQTKNITANASIDLANTAVSSGKIGAGIVIMPENGSLADNNGVWIGMTKNQAGQYGYFYGVPGTSYFSFISAPGELSRSTADVSITRIAGKFNFDIKYFSDPLNRWISKTLNGAAHLTLPTSANFNSAKNYRVFLVTFGLDNSNSSVNTKFSNFSFNQDYLVNIGAILSGNCFAGTCQFTDTAVRSGEQRIYHASAYDTLNLSRYANLARVTAVQSLGATDTIPPATYSSVITSQGIPTVTLTSSDGFTGWGTLQIEYMLSGSTTQGWTTYTEPFTITNPGDTTITYRSIDAAGNIEEPKTVQVTVVSDSDGDGAPNQQDACPNIFGRIEFDGCPAAISLTGKLNILYQGNIDGYAGIDSSGKQRKSRKIALIPGPIGDSRNETIDSVTARIFTYEKIKAKLGSPENDFDKDYDSHYKASCVDVYNTVDPLTEKKIKITPVSQAQIDALPDLLGVPSPDKYVLAERVLISDPVDGLTRFATVCRKINSTNKFNYDYNNDKILDPVAPVKTSVIKTIRNNCENNNPRKICIQTDPADDDIIMGSQLNITYPQTAFWEDGTSSYVYSYIFESDSDWALDICSQAPAGYQVVGVYDEMGNLITTSSCTQTLVANEYKIVAFEVAEIGSPPSFDLGSSISAKHKGKATKLNLKTKSSHQKSYDLKEKTKKK